MPAKKMFVILSLAFVGCGGSGRYLISHCAQEFEAGGMHICAESPLPDYVPDLIDKLPEEIEYQVSTFKPISGFKSMLEAVDEHLTLLVGGNLDGQCEALNDGLYRCYQPIAGENFIKNNSIVVDYEGCGSIGVIGHEMIHSVEEFFFDGATFDHSTPNLFTETNLENSADIQVFRSVWGWCWGANGVDNTPPQ